MNNVTLFLYQSDKIIDRALSRKLRDRALALFFGKTALSYADHIDGKKPRLAFPSGVFFNVSHSKGVFLLAVSDTDVGVDIEYSVPAERAGRLAARFFPRAQQDYLNRLEQTALCEEFTRLWCEKEARGKLSGEGVWSTVGKEPDAVRYTDLRADLRRLCGKNAPFGCLCTEKECSVDWVILED